MVSIIFFCDGCLKIHENLLRHLNVFWELQLKHEREGVVNSKEIRIQFIIFKVIVNVLCRYIKTVNCFQSFGTVVDC